MFPMIKGIMAAKDAIGAIKGMKGGMSDVEQALMEQGTPLQAPSMAANPLSDGINQMLNTDGAPPEQDEIQMAQNGSAYDPMGLGGGGQDMSGMDKFMQVFDAFRGGFNG